MSVALFTTVLRPAPAAGEETRTGSFVSGSATCPDPAAVQAEVFRLTSPQARAAHLSGAEVNVFDAGQTYSVEIDTGSERFSKTYSDPARECEKRVRFAAVYVVMTLMPPELATPPEASKPVEGKRGQATGGPSSARPPAAEERARARPEPPAADAVVSRAERGERSSRGELMDLEVGLTGQWSISSSEVPRIDAYGGELLGALGRGSLAWVLALGVAPPQSFQVGPVRAKALEVSSRTGARARWEVGGLVVAMDAGLAFAWRRIQGRSVVGSEPQTTAELGAHVSVSGWVSEWRRLGPVLGLRAWYFPSPPELSALPSGRLGTLPTFWVGGLVGLHTSL